MGFAQTLVAVGGTQLEVVAGAVVVAVQTPGVEVGPPAGGLEAKQSDLLHLGPEQVFVQ